MSSLGQGQTLRQRARSLFGNNRVGAIKADFPVQYRSVAAPGAVGARLFTAPAPCRVVAIREVHTTAGAGASVISVRKHLAAHVAAPDAALATTNITSVAEVPADATVNVQQSGTLSTVSGVTSLATGDKLMAVTPATLAGVLLDVWLVWL